MTKYILYTILFLGAVHSVFSQTSGIGVFNESSDIGNCGVKGSALYDSTAHAYTISGSGADIWGTHDAFHYVWKTMKGDFVLQFDFSFVGNGKHPGRKVGWMIRNDISDSSAHINGMVHNTGLTCIQYRLAKGGTTSAIDSKAKVLDIVRFERRGNMYILSTATKGEPFTILEFTDTAHAINDEACVGIFVCSHENETRESAVIRNVSITVPEHYKKNIIVWDGEHASPGAGWVTKNGECTVKPQTTVAHSGSSAVQFRFKSWKVASEADWIGAGWNWVNWQVGPYGTDITGMKYFSFWLKVEGAAAEMRFNLLCNGAPALDMPEHHTEKVIVSKYCPRWKDGQWHQITIPLKDLVQPAGFDAAHVAEMQFFNTGNGDGSFYIDDLVFSDSTGPAPL